MSNPLYEIDAATAFRTAAKNPLRKYPEPDTDGERLYPLASPSAKASFQINPDDTIFAIGSCFARNVEVAMMKAGLSVLSRDYNFAGLGKPDGTEFNLLNKYTIHSILTEIEQAFDRSKFPGTSAFYQLPKGEYYDAQIGVPKLDLNEKQVLKFKNSYLDHFTKIADADVIILTLGYVEAWYDHELEVYLNVAPPPAVVRSNPERFSFRVLSYEDVRDGLESLYNVLRSNRKKELKMLVTVSPVPLQATFRDMDVLVANAYSKAVQRAALDEFVRDKEGVDYFPSYEFVTLSDPRVAWFRNDYRHVSPDVVTRIMANVIDKYVKQPKEGQDGPQESPEMRAAALEEYTSSARMLSTMREWHKLLKHFATRPDLLEGQFNLLVMKAEAHEELDQKNGAIDTLITALEPEPDRPAFLRRVAVLAHKAGREEIVQEYLEKLKPYPVWSGRAQREIEAFEASRQS